MVRNRRLEKEGPFLGMRHMQVLLLFLNIVVILISRENVGIALVSMTSSQSTNPDFPQFDWSINEISCIISSFYWGYVLTQLAGGALAKHFGPKLTMGLATFVTAILSALTPWCIGWGSWKAFCGVRILQGLSQGMIFPGIFQHLAKWSPVEERTRLGAISYTGIQCGAVLALYVGGMIAASPLGWPGISYISAALCFVWCILWWIFAANNTTESKFITEAEKCFIETSLGHSEDFHGKKIPIPWKAIFTSVPVHALFFVRCATTWNYFTMHTQISSYLNGVLELEATDIALFSALPFFVMWGMSYVFVIVADIILRKDILALTALRKTFSSIALWTPVATSIAIGFLEKDQAKLALTLLIINMSLSGGTVVGGAINTIDLSPNHAGILMGIGNTIVSCISLTSPLVVGAIVTDTHDRSQWQIVFTVSAVIVFTGNLIFVIWGSTKTQPWDAEDYLVSKKSKNDLS